MTFGVEIDVHHPRKDGSCAVRLTIHHRTLQRVSMDFTVMPEHWANKRVKAGDPLSKLKNLRIEKTLNEAMRIHLQEPGLSARQLKARLTEKPGEGHDFYSLARERLELLRQGKKLAYNSRYQREAMLRLIEGIKPGLDISDFTKDLLEELQRVLVARGLHQNTVTVHLSNLSAVWSDLCAWKGLDIPSPWSKVELKTVPTKKRGLLPEQLEQLRTVDLSGQSFYVQLARDAMVTMYYLAGLRRGDMMRLDEDDFQGEELHYQMHKSDKIIRWRVHPHAREIMDRYKGKSDVVGGKRLIFPYLKASDFEGGEDAVDRRINIKGIELNRGLKVAARLAGLPEITSHWARHTHATKAKKSGVNNFELQGTLGHSSSRTTDLYARELIGDFEEAYEKMHGKG